MDRHGTMTSLALMQQEPTLRAIQLLACQAESVGSCGQPVRPCLPGLVASSSGRFCRTFFSACQAVSAGPSCQPARPCLQDLLVSLSGRLCRTSLPACQAVSEGPSCQPVRPSLQDLLVSMSGRVCRNVQSARQAVFCGACNHCKNDHNQITMNDNLGRSIICTNL